MYKAQGDVNFRSTTGNIDLSVAKDYFSLAKFVGDGILARGEFSGHSHRLETLDAAELYELEEGKMVLIVGENGVSIIHEEHEEITLPKGTYEVTIDREYTGEGEERRVTD